MPFIAFLGCDGSGKSAVISGMNDRMIACGISVSFGHWRPVAIGGGSAKPGNADDPHNQKNRPLLSSLLKLGWLWFNWWTAWFSSLSAQRKRGLILFDRYHADLLVDPRRYRYGAPLWVAKLASRLMPQPDRVFFLDAPPAVLLSRKQEVGEEALARSRSAYLSLARNNPRFRVIDASAPLDEVIAAIETEILPLLETLA